MKAVQEFFTKICAAIMSLVTISAAKATLYLEE
jgi:hypothetical protein